MKTIGLAALPETYENYIWVLYEEAANASSETGQAWVVDPGESEPVLGFLKEHHLSLQAILITHGHHDHISGVEDLKAAFPHVTVYGPKLANLPLADVHVEEGDKITLTDTLTLKVLNTPGHTQDHIAYLSDADSKMLFCGDTLFTAGCGRQFTGTFAQFAESILKLRELADDTKFYCAHEYTMSNLKFAWLVEPENAALRQRIRDTHINYPQPWQGAQSSLGLEKATNPFMRFDTPSIRSKLIERGAQDTPESLFKTLRLWKDELDQSGALNQVDLSGVPEHTTF